MSHGELPTARSDCSATLQDKQKTTIKQPEKKEITVYRYIQKRQEQTINRVLKCDVIKMKFLKLWDLSGYSERTMSKRPTCQK